MKVAERKLEKKYHDAVERWQREFFPDYDILLKHWSKFFPSTQQFCLCAKHDLDTPDTVPCGKMVGQAKVAECEKLHPEQGKRLLQIIKAQASTEFGSIQQHQQTLDKATDDQEYFNVMRVMAEELRHGYQMFDVLLNDKWAELGGTSGEEIVEEVLSMRTGSHVLGAFNIEYDSFLDSIVFAAVIDRVGKYQLTMQKVCAYKPMSSSMTPMLEEEAFHLVAGVFPLRRWLRRAAAGEPGVTTDMIQSYLNKWIPRGYEMFGDERGGQTNIDMSFKDMTNAEALDNYKREIERMVHDLNKTYLRARIKGLKSAEAGKRVDWMLEHQEEKDGVAWTELLTIPDMKFFRRRGQSAYERWDTTGTKQFDDNKSWFEYLGTQLPEPYLIHRDFVEYYDQMSGIESGEMTVKDAMMQAPRLFRTSYCPCSKSVRWIQETPEIANEDGTMVSMELTEEQAAEVQS